MKTHVSLSVDGPVARLVLTPEPEGKPNTLDEEVLDAIEAAIESLEQNEEVRLLLIESASPKYFVVGANLRALREIDAGTIRPWIHRGHDVFNRLEKLPIPVIAVVRGVAYGGGFELALSCDMIYAGENARFALPEAGLGFVPGWGGTQRLTRLIGTGAAKRMIYTGRPVDATEAAGLGIVAFCGSEEALDRELAATVEAVVANSAISLTMCKQLTGNAWETPAFNRAFEEAVASVACLTSGDTQRRLKEFFEKRS